MIDNIEFKYLNLSHVIFLFPNYTLTCTDTDKFSNFNFHTVRSTFRCSLAGLQFFSRIILLFYSMKRVVNTESAGYKYRFTCKKKLWLFTTYFFMQNNLLTYIMFLIMFSDVGYYFSVGL